MSEQGAISQFIQQLNESIEQQGFQRLVLSRYRGEEDLQRITIRLIEIKQQPQLSFVYSYRTQDITKNHPVADALTLVEQLLEDNFRQANLLTLTTDIQLSISKKCKAQLRQSNIESTQNKPQDNTSHNREKQRYLSLDRPFLIELGIADKQGKLIPSMSRKWRQINKFLEIIAAAIKNTGLDKKPAIRIADFGSGKAYLTFAVHDFISNNLALEAAIIGVELRQELVDLCNNTVQKLNLQGIVFDRAMCSIIKARG